MTNPIRVQLSRRKGFRLADAAGNGLPTIKVDRTTRWGNNGPYGTYTRLRAAELRGHNLACWCPLPAPGETDTCHAAVLLEIANAHEATQ